MSRIGRHRDGLSTLISPLRRQHMYIVLTIRSKRIRGLYPQIVPFLSEIAEKPSSRICSTPCSPCSLEIPYGKLEVAGESSS